MDKIKIQILHNNGKKYLIDINCEIYLNKARIATLRLHKTVEWQAGSRTFTQGTWWAISTMVNGYQLVQGRTKESCIKQFNLLLKRLGKKKVLDEIYSVTYSENAIPLNLDEPIPANHVVTNQ